MLSSPEFTQTIQNVSVPGKEAKVMGEYLPELTYMSTEEFESLGRKSWKKLP